MWIDWIFSFFAINANNITDMQVDIHLPKENGLKSLNLMVSHTTSHDYSFFSLKRHYRSPYAPGT